jgi:hypothetical protein
MVQHLEETRTIEIFLFESLKERDYLAENGADGRVL